MKCKPYKPSCCTCFFLYATGICIYIWSYLSLRQTTTVTRPAVISHLAKIIRRVNLNSTLGVPDYTETYQLNSKNIIKTSAIPFQSVSIADQINVSTVEGRSSDATKTTLKGTFTTTERRKGTSTGLATLGIQEPLEITENFTNLSKSILLKPSTRQNLKSTEKQQLSLTSLKAFGVSATVKVDNYSHTVSDTDKPGINSVAAVSASSITLSVKNVSNIDVSTSTVSSINNTKSPRTESVSNGEFGNHSDSTVGIIGTTVTADTSKIPTEIAPTTAALPSAVSLDDSKGESTELGSSSKGQEGKYPDMDFKTITSTTVPANTNPIATDDILTTTASAFTVSSNVRTDVSPTRDMTIIRSDNRLTTTRNDNVISHKNVSNTHQVYLCVNPSGRLGNLMFQFASLVGTARLHNMTPAISEGNPLRRIFNMSITELNSTIASAFPRVGDKRHCAFDPISADFSSNLTLSGFFQSWRYFSNVSSELREQFTFKVDIVKRARSALEASLYSQHRNFSLENTTFVGVHVRRGDILESGKIKFGYAVGSKYYLFQAINYFINRYDSVMFIVCSNDIKWAKETIPCQNATFITDQEAEVDMAILSLCNHTIMTVGSYGWWSAWLAGGTTIYQIQQTIPGTDLDKRFNLTDYMLPDWIGMNQTSSEMIPQTHVMNISTKVPIMKNTFNGSAENLTSFVESRLVVISPRVDNVTFSET